MGASAFVSQGSILINDVANVTFSDDASSNGVIHVIDTVLVPKRISLTEDASLSPIKFTSKGTVRKPKPYAFDTMNDRPLRLDGFLQDSIHPVVLHSPQPSSNLSDVANGYGYKTFYKLLEVSVPSLELSVLRVFPVRTQWSSPMNGKSTFSFNAVDSRRR